MPVGVYKHKPLSKKHKKAIGKSNSISLIGNKNALGHGGLIGNQNALGHKGCTDPLSDKHKEKLSRSSIKRYEDPKERERCPFYIDGRSSKYDNLFYYRLEHRRWSKQIRKRDDHICQLCGKRGWCAHHIDYDPENLDLDDGICLCLSCHSKTNVNRNLWTEFFQILISIFKEWRK